MSGDGGHGGGDVSFDTGHSAGVDHSPSIDVSHSHGNGHDSGHSHSGEADHTQLDEQGQKKKHGGAMDDGSWATTGDMTYATADDVVQGPSAAPTKEGVSTAGMDEKDAKFITACYDADVPTIEAALDKGQDVNVLDVNRRSALHFCAGNGLPTLCRRLLEMGADIDARDVLGFTPLHMATGYQKLDSVKLLLEENADSNIASLQGELAVEIAERMLEGTPEKKFFMKNGDHSKLKELVEVLDEATELEEDEEEAESPAAIVEEKGSAKFVVRIKPKGESGTPPPPDPPASDVKVTIRVKEPKK